MTAVVDGHVRDFTLLLPPGWVRLPLDDRTPLRVKQLVETRVQGVPPEQQAALRSALVHELHAALDSAGRAGGTDVLLSLDPVAGVPVPASALVTQLGAEGGDGELDALASTMALGEDGVEVEHVGVVEVAGRQAVRRRSTRSEVVEPAGGLPGGTLRTTQLDYVVPVPGGSDVLLLAFSTPVEALADPLVGLFDVMATSLRWVRA